MKNDLCIGCGLCARICPQGALEMQWNQYGEYNPVEVTACTTECGLCLKVCPFADNEENEDTIGKELYGNVPGISHRPEAGYYLSSYVGYSEKHRPTSASGGMATWLLEALLTQGIVDHVICAAPTGDPERLFDFRVFDTPEGVRKGAGSAYYPMEMSGIIRHILDNPGRYAVTGLPCFLKALRLAQKRNRKLRERVVVTVGLTCGQLKSRHFTEYISALAGVQGEVTAVRYRGKCSDHPASNYHYTFTTEDGKESRIFWNEGIGEAWTNQWFTPKACSYCDDIFAECADVTCMDAWLPDYSKDSRGTSLVIVRSSPVDGLIRGGIEDRAISVEQIPVLKVIQSQAGVIDMKRKQLAYRLHLAGSRGSLSPTKRVSPAVIRNPFKASEVRLRDQMQVRSRQAFVADYNGKNLDLAALQNKMKPCLVRVHLLRWVSGIVMLPLHAIRYILRIIKRN